MFHSETTARKSEAGFTLVELAVVMIIIGLLIGGVLKGQQLINNAQVTATVSQAKAIDAAVGTFKDMYNALPGDIQTPSSRLPNCTAALCGGTTPAGGGFGDGTLANRPNAPVLNNTAVDGGRFFVQLAAADIFSGVNPSIATTTAVWGESYPEARVGGGFTVGYSPAAAAADFAPNIGANYRTGLYLALLSTVVNPVPTAGPFPLTPNQAANIDRKIDDGNAAGGSVRAFGGAPGATTCAAATTFVYNEAVESAQCGLYIRIQG